MTPKAIKVACSNCNLRELCMPVDLDDSDMDKIDTLVATRRKIKRGAALFSRGRAHFRPNVLGNAGRVQRLPDPPHAIAAPQQAAGAGAGEHGIVNIARRHEPRDDLCHRGRALPVPTALAQFAAQVTVQFRGAGGKARDIGQRQLLQPGGVKRPGIAAGLGHGWPYSCHSMRQMGRLDREV